MRKDGKKVIGVFASRVAAEYQTELCQSIAKRATELGYYTFIYMSFGGYGSSTAYVDGERYVAKLPDYENLDGIILAIDTFEEPMLENDLLENIRTRATCPVVCVRRPVEGYHSVLVDNVHSMEAILRHFIEDHGFTDICYVSGPKDHPDAIPRLDCYRRILKEYDIPYRMDNVFFGNFWRNQGKAICDMLLEGRDQYPQAIVCANDYMAISVQNELSDRGIRVPEDVCVSGFDNVKETETMLPALSTIKVDVTAMGVCAVETVDALCKGETVPVEQYIPTKTLIRESCGCEKVSKSRMQKATRAFYDQSKQYMHYNQSGTFMAIDVASANDMLSLGKVVFAYLFNNYQFRDFFIVLNDYDWATKDKEELTGFTGRVHLRMAVQNDRDLGYIDRVFPLRDQIPAEFLAEEPCAYYLAPLHYDNACFGYVAINHWHYECIDLFFQTMHINISNALESIRIREKLNASVDNLKHFSEHDALTGLYNRYGFERYSTEMYEKAVQERRTFTLIGIDMDGLKTINDTFGHAQGDAALRTLGSVMLSACFESEICARVGGDEFIVVALDYDVEKTERFLTRMQGFLDDYNARSQNPYVVQASVGFAIAERAGEKTREEWITISDNQMYNYKEKNRNTRKILRNDKKESGEDADGSMRTEI